MNLFAWYWLLVVVVGILYVALMVWFMVGWRNIKYFATTQKNFNTSVSVIVPFYNEASSIKECLLGILEQNIQTKKFQLIAVNDHSSDGSCAIVEELLKSYNQLVFVNNSEKGKKQAIKTGVDAAVGELIITTDADCSFSVNWLNTMVDYYEKHKPGMIIGPVGLEVSKGFFQRFQLLEFNSLIMTTAGAAGIGHPIMCNGANLAFQKRLFQSIDNPLNDKFISGDDVFLMHSLKKETEEEIHFLKSHDALVKTKSVKGFKAFFKQRERWASKATGFTDGDTLFTASIVVGVVMLLIVGLLLLAIQIPVARALIFLFVVKLVADLYFFNTTDSFFKHRMGLPYFILFEILHVFYVSYTGVVGILNTKKWQKEKA